MIRLLKSLGIAALSLALTACEVPIMIAASQNGGQMTGATEITFPALIVVQTSDGSEFIYAGSLVGYANGSADFEVTNPELGSCVGRAENGLTNIMCDNGLNVQQPNDGRARMTGSVVASGEIDVPEVGALGYLSAFGWGNDANEDILRSKLQEAS